MTINKVNDQMTQSLIDIQKRLSKLPREIYDFWIKKTPVKSGNARRQTRLEANKIINAKYPYAQRLDEGYSKQAPQGMSKPTDQFIKQRIKQLLRK